MFNFFKKAITDEILYKELGKEVYIRNGVGFSNISDNFLYDNCFLQLGFGKTISGYGDWGGGCSHVATSPLKITININCIIQKVETDSFYNSNESKTVEQKAKKLINKLPVGSKLIIKDELLLEHLSTIFSYLPVKEHIGYWVFSQSHMLDCFIRDMERKRKNV